MSNVILRFVISVPSFLTLTPALIDTLRRRESRQGLWRWRQGQEECGLFLEPFRCRTDLLGE